MRSTSEHLILRARVSSYRHDFVLTRRTRLPASNSGACWAMAPVRKRSVSDDLGLAETASQVESGWGAVASEWGVLGLLAWVAWSLLWVRRALRAGRAKGSAAAEIAPVVAGYVASLLLLMFSLGSGFLDDYIANIFLWFLSGARSRRWVTPKPRLKGESLTRPRCDVSSRSHRLYSDSPKPVRTAISEAPSER